MNKYQKVEELYNNPYLYDIEFKEYHDDIYFWPQMIRDYNPKSLIEIGCGTGRVAKLVAPLVKKYTGLDFSKEFINYFKENNREIISQYNVELINQDMKKMNIDYKYDMVILPFNVFVYLYTSKDIKDFFIGIEKIIKKNTIIIVDLTNNHEEDFTKTDYRLCNELINNDKEKIQLYEKHSYDIENQIINYSKKYIWKDSNKKVVLDLPVKVYTVEDFVNISIEYNYSIEKIYGDYDKSEYSASSRKQIIVLRKK